MVVAFSPDGKTIASTSGGTLGNPGDLKLWDAATGRELASLKEAWSIRWVAFSPDGKTLATAEHDNTAKLRDAASGAILRQVHRPWLRHRYSGLLREWQHPGNLELGQDGQALGRRDRPGNRDAPGTPGRRLFRCLQPGRSNDRLRVQGRDGQALGCRDRDGSHDPPRACGPGPLRCILARRQDRGDGELGQDGQALVGDYRRRADDLERTHGPGSGCGVLAGRQDVSLGERPMGDGDYAPGPGEIKLWDATSYRTSPPCDGHPDRIFASPIPPTAGPWRRQAGDGTVKLWDVNKLLKLRPGS